MSEKNLKQIADKIEKHLQNEWAEEWHIKLEEKSIIAHYTNIKIFTLVFDEYVEDWYINGEYINVNMIAEINEIIIDN